MKKGDQVNYIPGEANAFQFDPRGGGFPWVFGRLTGRKDPADKSRDEVIELTDDELGKMLQGIRKKDAAQAKRDRDRLVMIRPKTFWAATVRGITEEADGTLVDLDIKDPTTGATLHYDGVVLDPEAATPDSCHKIPDPNVIDES